MFEKIFYVIRCFLYTVPPFFLYNLLCSFLFIYFSCVDLIYILHRRREVICVQNIVLYFQITMHFFYYYFFLF